MITRSDVVLAACFSGATRLQRISIVLAGCLAACGGGSKGASSPSTSTSQISMKIVGDPALGGGSGTADISGAAFAQFDPDQKALMIYVFDPATQPAPSCDHMGIEALIGQKSGNSAVIAAKDFSGAPGKVKGAMAMIFQGDASQNPNPPQGMLDATTIDLSRFDKTFDAQFTTASSAKSSITGTLHGTVCPRTSIEAQAQAAQLGGANMAASTESGLPTDFALAIESNGETQTRVAQGESMVKLDPKTKVLAIATWLGVSASPGDKPGCDLFAEPKKSVGNDVQVSIIYAKNVGKRGPGKFDVYAGEVIAGTPGQPNGFGFVGKVVASVDVEKFDDKDFNAHFISTAKLNDEKGTIVGTVCPNGHVEAPLAASDKPKTGKKKK